MKQLALIAITDKEPVRTLLLIFVLLRKEELLWMIVMLVVEELGLT